MDTKEKIEGILREFPLQLDDDIDENETFASMGADSLDEVEMLIRFEEEFGIEIADWEAEKITTVKEAVQFIEDL